MRKLYFAKEIDPDSKVILLKHKFHHTASYSIFKLQFKSYTSEKSVLIVQLEGSLLSLPMLPLCLPQTYYSSHCNINIHLLFCPPYCIGSQLRMEPIAYTFCDTNSKPRARIWQKIFHQKQQKQYIILSSQNSVRHSTTWAN